MGSSADIPEGISRMWCRQDLVNCQLLGDKAKNWGLEQLDFVAWPTREDGSAERQEF